MQLINCEIKFILTWSAKCVVSNAAANRNTTFAIIGTRLCVPVATLSTQDNSKLLQQLESGFKCAQLTGIKKTLNVPNPYLYCLLEPIFQRVLNRLFAVPFNALNDRTGHSRYYIPTTKAGEYNVMIIGKTFLISQLKIN